MIAMGNLPAIRAQNPRFQQPKTRHVPSTKKRPCQDGKAVALFVVLRNNRHALRATLGHFRCLRQLLLPKSRLYRMPQGLRFWMTSSYILWY